MGKPEVTPEDRLKWTLARSRLVGSLGSQSHPSDPLDWRLPW